MKRWPVYTSIIVLMFSLGLTSYAGDAPIEIGDGLRYVELDPGSGPKARKVDSVTIHCAIWLDDGGTKGTEIINTRGEQPLAFKLGANKGMPAFNPGVTGMRAGGKRLLFVPPHLGYGDRGLEDVVPPGANLIIEVELLEIKN